MTRKRNRTAGSQAPLTTPERKKRNPDGSSLQGGCPAPFSHKNAGQAETSDKKDRQNSTVHVGDLSPETTVCELKSRFDSFGSISRVKIADESGYGFITFRAKESAESAIKAAADPYGIRVTNKRVTLSWANDPLHRWKMGVGFLQHGQDVLTEKLPSKIPHGREGRGGNRESVLAAAVAAAGSRGVNEKADALYHGREVVAYDDLL